MVQEKRIDLTVVGPEAPLAEGIVNQFTIRGREIFGPSQAAARIETSKVFAKELMQKYNIPCARSASFDSYSEAKAYLEKQKPPIVVKADGLAAGKGATVADTTEQVQQALAAITEQKPSGTAGNRVLHDYRRQGHEIAASALPDAHYSAPIVAACDYQPVFDGDQCPNTAGMASYSPPHFYNPALGKKVTETSIEPTLKALYKEGIPYRGVLYGGLMITDDGPKVMEFNARLGDPETQVILPRLKTDLLDIILGVVNNELDRLDIEWSNDRCRWVGMAAGGSPDSYKKGVPIHALGDRASDILVFHAGTSLDSGGRVVTSGGRVLTVVASGSTIAEAREKVYNNIGRIHFEGCHYRKDIALFKKL